MITRCIVGICLVILCAAPVLGEEGSPKDNLKVSMFVDPGDPLKKPHGSAAQLQAKIKETLDYYDIDGATAAELRAQMKHNGTRWNDGKVYAALTTWDIRYHYDIKNVDGRYVLGDIRTTVNIAIHMPRLAPSAKTTDLLLNTWNDYQKNLKTHEMGHRNIAVAIGEEICQGLASLESSASKGELDHQAQALIKEKFKKLDREQIAYDEETHHGKLQGAVLQDPALAGGAPAPQSPVPGGSDES